MTTSRRENKVGLYIETLLTNETNMKEIAWKADEKLERRTKLEEDAELVCWKEDAKLERENKVGKVYDVVQKLIQNTV